MLSKWKFVGLWCLFRGKRKLAKKAFEFEKFLEKTYRKTTTDSWDFRFNKKVIREFFENDPVRVYIEIIESANYCVACETSNCTDCVFGEKFGVCVDDNSEFQKFEKEFKNAFNEDFEKAFGFII